METTTNNKRSRFRSGNTPETIFFKPKYYAIACLLAIHEQHFEISGIRRQDLAHYLIREKNKDEGVQPVRSKKKHQPPKPSDLQQLWIKRLEEDEKWAYSQGPNEQRLQQQMRDIVMDPVAMLVKSGQVTDTAYFKDVYQLRHAIKELRDLGLVTSSKPAKGYSMLVLTEKGRMLHALQNIRRMLSQVTDPVVLFRIECFIQKEAFGLEIIVI